ncbi:MAG: hypothetical protein IT340_00435 [Chloroflexi bacterium]|nr:hypothetical protein [Chloroflexota bacterium]
MRRSPARPWRWPLLALLLALLAGALPALAVAQTPAAAFDQVAAAAGPAVWSAPLLERAEDDPDAVGGRRLVRYYPEGRMDLTDPQSGASGVTYGRLVVELVTGDLAVGDSYRRRYAGADLPVVGDRDRAANPAAPTYRALRPLLARVPSAVGLPVETVLLPPEGSGVTTAVVAARRDPALGQLAINAVYIDDTGHNIPAVFWRALTAQGAAGGRTLTWTALYGWPLTEAVWVRAVEDGRAVDALVQLFERRTLIYRPGAPAGQQVRAGAAGRDYLAWRDRPVNLAPNLAPPASRNGLALPAVGEAGTAFLVAGSGFQDGEQVDAWLETEGAVYPQPSVRLRPGGLFLGRLRTTPVITGALEVLLVVQGRASGHQSIIGLRVLPTDGLTPGAEAIEPADVPPGQARVVPALLPVGQVGELRAAGFAPGEPVTAWVTTGLHREIPWRVYIESVRFPRLSGGPAVAPVLRADPAGQVLAALPGPGVATTGIFAVTLVGNTSGQQAIAYFRARAGAPWLTNYQYGVERAPAQPASLDGPAATWQPALEMDDEAVLDPALLATLLGSAGEGDAS